MAGHMLWISSVLVAISSSICASDEIMVREQTSLMQCSNSTNCYPDALQDNAVPEKYINCSNNRCICSECFYSSKSYTSCDYKRCWKYDNATHTCEDMRKDQRTAFFLALFLSAIGAANFYVGQYAMGGIQLCLLIVMPFLWCGLWLFIFILLIWLNLDGRRYFNLFSGILLLVGISLWLLPIMMWWVADVQAFAEDIRLSGDGCPLKHNL